MISRNIFPALVLLPLCASSVYAQDDELNETNIEVIEVLAQKRAQNINDIAVAITYLDQEVIEKNYLKDTTELSALVPNLKITQNAGEGTPPAFNIRGIGMIDYNTSTVSPISIYSDGVISGNANNLSVNLFDLDGVEVLRGPQGTLFGRNTTGGAILLHSKKPEFEQSGYIKKNIATNGTGLTSVINLPISKNTAIRVASNYQNYRFSTDNHMDGQSDGGLSQSNFRISSLTQLTDLSIEAKYYQSTWSGTSKPVGSLGALKPNSNGVIPINTEGEIDYSELCPVKNVGTRACEDFLGNYNGGDDYWDVLADNNDRTHYSESWGADLTLNWQLNNDVTLTSISAAKNLDRYHGWDSDGPGNFIEGTMDTNNTVISQELMSSVKFDSAYWISGLFYLNEETSQNNDIDLFADFGGQQFFYDNDLENTSIAVYSQLDYSLNADTSVTIGGRFTKEETKYRVKGDLSIADGPATKQWDSTTSDWNGPRKVEDDELSGKLAIHHKINKQVNIYASASKSHKSGGYNAGYATQKEEAEDSHYKPEKLNAYEIGTKLTLLDNALNVNLAAFYYDYKDQQIFINKGFINHVLKNAGDSEIYGLDTELYYYPTKNLSFNLNLGYLPKANIGKYNNGNISVDDNRLPMTSEINLGGYVLHELPIWGGLLTSQLSFDYQSDFYFDQNENPYTEQKAFTIFNGRVTYQFDDKIEVSIWGKNLTNTEHSDLLFDSIGALGAISELKAEARQFGIELGYHF